MSTSQNGHARRKEKREIFRKTKQNAWYSFVGGKIKNKTKQTNIQNNQRKTQPTNRTRCSSQRGLRLQLGPLPCGRSPRSPYSGTTRRGGNATRQKRRGRTPQAKKGEGRRPFVFRRQLWCNSSSSSSSSSSSIAVLPHLC